jgi:hypothetical protein
MSNQIHRNQVVKILGTPDRTEGSLNDPREQREGSIVYNEKWIYEHRENDPAGAGQRAVFWHRYDFVATLIRAGAQEQWRHDEAFPKLLLQEDPRVSEPDLRPNPPITPTRPYQAVSDFKGAPDLGGHIEGQGGNGQ